jgi:hypothetical protein
MTAKQAIAIATDYWVKKGHFAHLAEYYTALAGGKIKR